MGKLHATITNGPYVGEAETTRRNWIVSALWMALIASAGLAAGCAGPRGGPRRRVRRRIRRRTRRRVAARVAMRRGRRVLSVASRPASGDVVVIAGHDAEVSAVTTSNVTVTTADGTRVEYELEVETVGG